MKVLVTGSTGFIGSQLCRALLVKGYEVRAFHRPSSPLRTLEGLEVEHSLGDLTQPDTIQAAMQGIEAVFHVGGSTDEHAKPERLHSLVIEATRSVLQAAMNSKVKRLVYSSSVAALGIPESNPSGQPIPALLDENHTWNIPPETWHYGYAKYLAELEIQKTIAQGFDAVIVNPALVFGAGDVYRQSSSIIVQMARRKIPALVEGGINIVHIADVTAGHIAALERGERGERYILGSENLSFEQLIRQIAEIAHVPAPTLVLSTALVRWLSSPLSLMRSFLPLPLPAQLLRLAGNYFFYSNRKSQVKLGLIPAYSAHDALLEAYNWFQEAGAIHQK